MDFLLKVFKKKLNHFIFNNLAHLLKKISIKVYTYKNNVYFYIIKR